MTRQICLQKNHGASTSSESVAKYSRPLFTHVTVIIVHVDSQIHHHWCFFPSHEYEDSVSFPRWHPCWYNFFRFIKTNPLIHPLTVVQVCIHRFCIYIYIILLTLPFHTEDARKQTTAFFNCTQTRSVIHYTSTNCATRQLNVINEVYHTLKNCLIRYWKLSYTLPNYIIRDEMYHTLTNCTVRCRKLSYTLNVKEQHYTSTNCLIPSYTQSAQSATHPTTIHTHTHTYIYIESYIHDSRNTIPKTHTLKAFMSKPHTSRLRSMFAENIQETLMLER